MSENDELEVFHLLSEVRKSPFQRMYLEACLLTQAPLEDIADTLGYPLSVVQLYLERDYRVASASKMRKLEHIHSISDPEERNLKLWALTQGLSWVKWRLGLGSEVSPVNGLQMLLPDCVYKAKQAFFEANGTIDDAEARKWTMVSLAVSRQVKAWVTDKKDLLEDLELALKQIDAEDADIPNLSDIGDDPSLLPDVGVSSAAEELDAALKELSEDSKVGQHPAAKAIWPEKQAEPDWDLLT
jgi:hypothetical protein